MVITIHKSVFLQFMMVCLKWTFFLPSNKIEMVSNFTIWIRRRIDSSAIFYFLLYCLPPDKSKINNFTNTSDNSDIPFTMTQPITIFFWHILILLYIFCTDIPAFLFTIIRDIGIPFLDVSYQEIIWTPFPLPRCFTEVFNNVRQSHKLCHTPILSTKILVLSFMFLWVFRVCSDNGNHLHLTLQLLCSRRIAYGTTLSS